MDSKSRWGNNFTSKKPNEVIWLQDTPDKSLQLINEVIEDKNTSILDANGSEQKYKYFILKKEIYSG